MNRTGPPACIHRSRLLRPITASAAPKGRDKSHRRAAEAWTTPLLRSANRGPVTESLHPRRDARETQHPGLVWTIMVNRDPAFPACKETRRQGSRAPLSGESCSYFPHSVPTAASRVRIDDLGQRTDSTAGGTTRTLDDQYVLPRHSPAAIKSDPSDIVEMTMLV